MNLKILSFSVLALVLIGCSKSGQIDGQGLEIYRKSVVLITEGMSQDEQSMFMENIELLNLEYGGYQSTVDTPDLKFRAYINGKSIPDINNESIKIKKRNKIASLKDDIYLTTGKIAKLKLNIAAKIEQIQGLEQSIEKLESQRKARDEGTKKAKEILNRLVISEAKYSRPPEDKENPLWMRNFKNARMDFKIVNGTEYLVAIENVTINSGKEKIVIKGSYQCKGPGNQMLGLSWKIQPNSEKTIQCEISPNVEIDDSGTIEVSGGSVLGVGEFNPESKSPLSLNKIDYFADYTGNRDQTRLEEAQVELENMEATLLNHQESMMQMCNVWAGLEKDSVRVFICQ